MTVIRPNSISGVSSITGQGGDISIFRADGTAADLIVNNVTTGVITATSFSGSGANLTSIPAGQLTGTVADARLSTVSSSKLSGALPAIDGSALTGIVTSIVAGTNVTLTGGPTGIVTVGVTTEQVQDIVGAMFSGNTETNITATYQDSDGTIDLVASGGGGGGGGSGPDSVIMGMIF